MKKIPKPVFAVIVGCVAVLIVAVGMVAAVQLSRGDHLRNSYNDAGKVTIIQESPVIIRGRLDEVLYDGEFTTLVFAPGVAMKGTWDKPTLELRYEGDYTKQSVNLTPQPQFEPGGEYYLFLRRNRITGEIFTPYGFGGVFERGEDGVYYCRHHTARWQSFTEFSLFVDVHIVPQLRSEMLPTISPVPSNTQTKRVYETITPITPSPSPTRRSDAK